MIRMAQPVESMTVDPSRLVAAHREAARIYRGLLLDPYVGWPREHLASRGLGNALEVASRWQIGYAPASWTLLVEHLRRRGFGVNELDASGLVVRTYRGDQVDRFRDRIVIPIHDATGQPVGFVGRARPGAGGDVPRYLNTPVTEIYRKGEVLLGLAEQRDRLRAGAVPVLVEGPTDLLAVDATSGPARAVRAAVATCGTSLTAAQVAALRDVSRSDTIFVATDADSAGRRAATRAYDLLYPTFRTVLTPDLPSGSDPADVLRHQGPHALRAALGRATPLVHKLIEAELFDSGDVLDHLGGKLGVLRAVAPLVSGLPRNDVAREITWLARRLRLDHSQVTGVIVEAVAPDGVELPSARPRAVRRASELRIPVAISSTRETHGLGIGPGVEQA
jgi:DNA primase catalytic core